jgi:hypothetical protein
MGAVETAVEQEQSKGQVRDRNSAAPGSPTQRATAVAPPLVHVLDRIGQICGFV